jgi:tetratricopeptide (TPR) repeat protein
MSSKVRTGNNIFSGQILLSNKITWLSLFVLTFLVYGNSIFNEYNLDDELVTRNNKLTSSGISSIPEIFNSPYYSDDMGYSYEYRPITLTSFAIEHSIFGESAMTSHIVNVLLFFFTVVILFFLIKKLIGTSNLLAPILITTLFIVHPVHTEVVSSIKNRDEILSLLGGLLSFWFAVIYVNKGNVAFVLLSILFLILGLLSKVSVLSFVFLIPFWFIISKTFNLRVFILLLYYLSLVFIGLFLFSKTDFSFQVVYQKLVSLFTSPRNVIDNKFHNSDIFIIVFSCFSFIISFYTKNFVILIPASFILLFHSYYRKSFNIILLALPVIIFSFTDMIFFMKHVKWLYLVYLYIILSSANFKLVPKLLICIAVLFTYGLGSFFRQQEFIADAALPAIIIIVMFLFEHYSIAKNHKIIFWLIVLILTYGLQYFFSGKLKLITGLMPATIILYEFVTVKKANISVLLLISFLFAFESLNYSSPVFHKFYVTHLEKKLFHYNEIYSESNVKKQASVVKSTNDRPLDFIEYPLGFNAGYSKKTGTASFVLDKYLKLMFIPYPLGFYYGYNMISIREIYNPWSILSIIIHFGLIVFAISKFKSNPLLSFGIFTYLISIFLYSNLASPVAGMIGERLSFVASTGFCIAVGLLIFRLFDSLDMNYKKIALLIIILVFISYAALTINRNSNWENHITLMRHDINHLDNSAHAHNMLASNLMQYSFNESSEDEVSKMRNEAVIHYKKAINIYPDFFNAWYDLGRAYMLLNETDKAYPCFIKVHEIDSTLSTATMNLAMIEEERNDYASAIKYYEKVMRINPYVKESYGNLSFLYFRLNQPQLSIEVNKMAISNHPEWSEPYKNIARVYYALKDTAAAEYYMNEAFKRE